MTTGDEPMLPQPGDDNAPMISGRGTKVIADARGAYLAGNLEALIDAMTEDQQQRFRLAIWSEAFNILRALLRIRKLDDPSMHPSLAVLERFTRNPADPDTYQAIADFFRDYRNAEPERLHALSAASGEYPVDDNYLR